MSLPQDEATILRGVCSPGADGPEGTRSWAELRIWAGSLGDPSLLGPGET